MTRASDGRCSCGLASFPSNEDETYTDGCTTATGVCCVEGAACSCGADSCGPSATEVDSCEDPEALDAIADLYLEAGGGTREPSCSE